MDSTRERVRKALDALVYLPVDDVVPPASSKQISRSGERPACRAWDRSDLLRRLQSYKASTWFCKPPGAGPLDCARRGWINTSLDMLTCETLSTPSTRLLSTALAKAQCWGTSMSDSVLRITPFNVPVQFCAAQLSLPIPLDLPSDEVTKLGEGFKERLASSHDSACPWRTVACDPGLELFPPLERRTVCDMFARRQETLSRLNVLPPVAEDAYKVLRASRRTRLQELLLHGPQPQQQLGRANSQQENGAEASPASANGHAPVPEGGSAPSMTQHSSEAAARSVACHGSEEHVRRQRLLALMGWSAEVLAHEEAQHAQSVTVDAATAALRCAMCDARAGLWNFVPGMAVMSQKKSVHAPGSRSAGTATAVALASVDLSQTIAGGQLLHEESLPRSPGPFGSPHQAAPVFGVRSRRASVSPEQASQHKPSKPEDAQRSAPETPFGSAIAAASAFGGPLQQPLQAAGTQQAGSVDQTLAGTTSDVGLASEDGPVHGSSNGAGDLQPKQGPFGSSAGAARSVFGIEALKAAPTAGSQRSKRPRDPISASQDNSSAAGSKRPRSERAIADSSEAATGACSSAGVGSSALQALGQAAPGTEASRGETEPAGSFSFPVLTGQEGKGPPTIQTPAPKPKPVSVKPRRSSFSPLKAGAFEPFDPLQSHRAFCPWVSRGPPGASPNQAGQEEGRVGWRWCLDSLTPVAGPEEEAASGQPMDQRTKLLALLRNLG